MRRTIWWKNIFRKTLPQFVWDFERNAFGNENSQSCQNWNLRVRKNTLMKKHFFEKNFIHFFLLCSKTFLTSYNFFQSWQNCFSSGQTDTLVKKIFFEKRFLKILSDFGRNISQLSIQFLQGDCQNRFLHDQETFQGNRLSHFFLFSIHFRILGKSSHKFRINFSEKWWKLHSMFSDEHFDEKRRFWKIVFFSQF